MFSLYRTVGYKSIKKRGKKSLQKVIKIPFRRGYNHMAYKNGGKLFDLFSGGAQQFQLRNFQRLRQSIPVHG